jgi:hypothetical protein
MIFSLLELRKGKLRIYTSRKYEMMQLGYKPLACSD